MTFEAKLSRFASLPDDVSEPTVRAPKEGGDKPKKKKLNKDVKAKGGSGDATAKKKSDKGKSLKSMAFGLNEGKKAGNQSKDSANKSRQLSNTANGVKKTSEQFEDWQRRDHEVVDAVYENDLEAALVQSQLDYQTEVCRRESDKSLGKPKGKKKAIPVPLNEFNAMLLENPNPNGQANPYSDADDEELIQRFKNEARLQLEREKELTQQRELLASRHSEGVYKHPHSKERASLGSKDLPLDEQGLEIESLKAENELLKSELESYKTRLKKVHDIFQSAQELKDKAKLIFQVETLTKSQEELNEQVRELHSELEQERSKSHAAVNECRRLMQQQSRRRTNTDAST